MRTIVVSFLLLLSTHTFARSIDFANAGGVTPLGVSKIFDSSTILDISVEPDLVAKDEKVDSCMQEFILKKGKSYDKATQATLYDLMNNFKRVMSKVYGKKSQPDEISYDEKIESLARVECETYFALGVLK
jgi:hypothetical protein